MKRLILSAALVLLSAPMAFAQTQGSCAKIQSGTIFAANGDVITTGYDQYGYNYQAHMFNGLFNNNTRPPVPVTTGDVNLIMKWSDEWLSNLDCSGDHRLDKGLNSKTGDVTGISMGWLTNHMEGDCLLAGGDSVHVTYFVKMVWVGPPAVSSPDPWDGKRIWGVYAVIEEVGEDPSGGVCLGTRGLNRNSLVNPAGLGFWTNQ